MSEDEGIVVLVSEEIESDAPPELDWLANSTPAREREGLVNRTLRRFGLRLMRTSSVDRNEARKAKWGPFANEDHHNVYGRPWFIGRDYFDLLKSRGLESSDAVLDFGCGSMRAGVWIASFVDPGKYCGIDSHRASLDAAAAYEVPLHNLESKRPSLLHSSDFRVDRFDKQFDLVFCASVFRHLSQEDLPRALKAIRDVCDIGSRLIIQTSDIDQESDQLRQLGIHAHESFVWPSKFSGESRWTEYRVK